MTSSTPAAQRHLPAALLGALLLTLSCSALLACSPRQTTPPTRDDAAAPVASTPAPSPAPVPAPSESAPLATPASAPAGAECATVDDCATTRFEDGACCPMLCAPRATTKKAVQEALKTQCNTLVKCAQPLCLPPRFQHRLACEAGRCVMQMVGRVEQQQ
jgi:hypothetical protein